MGKRLIVQRRGRGTHTFKSWDHLKVGPAKYPPRDKIGDAVVKGVIEEFIHEPGRGTPLARVKLENGVSFIYIPPRGVFLGQEIEIGPNAEPSVGNILPVGKIPEGTMICNVELRRGDGGKIARRSGTYAIVFSHEKGKTLLRLRSKKEKWIKDSCWATVGQVAGGGRTELYFVKAGMKYHLVKKQSKKWPIVRGVAMNPVSHPHGGGSHNRPGKPTTVPRSAPPGQKVGHIAARWVGRKKKRRR